MDEIQIEEKLVAAGLKAQELPGGQRLFLGTLPTALVPTNEQLAALWEMHPIERAEIKMYGRTVKVPRWQQAFGVDYRFSGQVARALPVPAAFAPYLAWCRECLDPRLNGVLANWYDAALGHYIGAHRDKENDLLDGVPIVIVSFGAERVLRMQQWKGSDGAEFLLRHGTVVALPRSTNRAYTHAVPHLANSIGRRISLSVRAFEERAARLHLEGER